MTRNFLEMCRKDAKWPAIVRDVPLFSKGDGAKKSWAVSQDELADFIVAVRIRSDDFWDQFDTVKDERDALAEDKIKLQLMLAAYEAGRLVSRKAISLGVEPQDAEQIAEAASGAVHNVRKAS